jgi:hypothetical protein
MNYENLFTKFIERFPELIPLIDPEDVDSGLYIVFAMTINPYVKALLSHDEDNREQLKGLFSFFEEMAMSDIDEVRALLMWGFLESLGDDTQILATAHKYMGTETKYWSEMVEDFHGRSPWIQNFFFGD